MKISELEAEMENPVYRSRTSRVHKWIELVQQAQQQLELPPTPPERIMLLDHEVQSVIIRIVPTIL